MVSDGEVMYQEMNLGGQPMVNRIDVKAAGLDMKGMGGMGQLAPNAGASLAELRKIMDLTQREDATLKDGQKAWVIEGRFSQKLIDQLGQQAGGPPGLSGMAANMPMGGMRLYIGKRDLSMNRMEFLTGDGTEMGSMSLENLRINQGVDAADFVYEPPEGVPVNDMTETMRRQVQAAKSVSPVGMEEIMDEPEKKTAVQDGAGTAATAKAEVTGLLKPGTPAPAFSMKSIDKTELDLVKLRGRPVVIVFWATWHKDSVKLLAELDRVCKSHADKGVAMLSFSLDEATHVKWVAATVAAEGIVAPTAIGTDTLLDAYWVSEVPAYVLVDGEGKVTVSEVNPKDSSILKSALEKLLAQ